MRKSLLIGLIIIGTILMIYGLIIRVGMQGFVFAWVLNLMLMMCVYLFTQTLKPAFKSTYYNEKKWEKKGKIYESLGVNIFRKLLVLIGWEKINKKNNPVKKSLEALIHLEYVTKQSELGHLIIFFIVIPFTVFVTVKYGIVESLWLLILNLVLNIYPIILQRYNRPRLKKAINIYRYQQAKIKA
ncbi:hypothetical protein [Flavobacterium sp. GT3R68]|uniref:glycosyl-4,4'-diaponeurosporenoate acyltransferase CrtO family protein n=1 Tax=Flavobacterium sp. GT3R68 TaxID=2594437 RepID=UPI000F86B912|nr:hypothetical protein [Flavobacterium sp. GT3R68]RTY92419.1 hypothetical protein EKL32_17600 [Flavobacterium sp. GSN2]TRW92335.1 hypothetical protein FNW07_04815 [Flavobacterium sp. GT3R68]